MFNEYNIESIDLSNQLETSEIADFLGSQGLQYEPADFTLAVRKSGKIIGTGSVAGYVIKCLAIDFAYREGPAFSEIVSRLLEFLDSRGIHHSFVFTRPDSSISFEKLGFRLVEMTDSVALLEFGASIDSYLKYLEENREKEVEHSAAVIVNCNPFTLGHRYLIEQASQNCEYLYVIVVEEDRSVFPFEVRLELVRKGTADLKNAAVLCGGRYVVSSSTFPTYFLKSDQPGELVRQQAELDLKIFALRLAPVLRIRQRFVGTEDFCLTTAAYNEAMKKILPSHQIKLTEISRSKIFDGRIISASTVRAALKNKDFGTVKKMVPQTTFEFLISPAAKEIIQKIRKKTG
ncbi:MAG: [citrate (pro-3S)-lyase] ligase [Candidatus Wallbacteria bacterium]|nr:[citrate (pro-3S)-lyase] ligase [Candidatus Wallbacteria bacterium]